MIDINSLPIEDRRRIERVRQAFDRNQVLSIEIHRDGSGACFHYIDPTADHGKPCDVESSFRIDQAIIILAGQRLKQHELGTCF